MKAWFIFDVVNYLGFTERISVWANNIDEAKRKLMQGLEYPPMELKFIGNSCHNPKADIGHKSTYGMSATDLMIAYGLF